MRRVFLAMALLVTFCVQAIAQDHKPLEKTPQTLAEVINGTTLVFVASQPLFKEGEGGEHYSCMLLFRIHSRGGEYIGSLAIGVTPGSQMCPKMEGV